jgi:hypothetical protein
MSMILTTARRWFFPFGLLMLMSEFCASQEPLHRPLHLTSPLQDKNFYVLSSLERTPAVAQLVSQSVRLSEILKQRRAWLKEAVDKCHTVACLDGGFRWTDDEISSVAAALRELYLGSPEARTMISELRESGAYVRFAQGSPDELFTQAWIDAARGMNHVIAVYGDGKQPRYPKIDSPAFDVKSDAYANIVRTATDLLQEQSSEMTLFFQPTLRYALHLLKINGRDEAGRLEPLDESENARTLVRISTTEWSKFPFTVLVVPGQGADRLSWSLAPEGRLRIEIAVRRWRQGKAPFILVSGGYVHPAQTPFAEALEMKKALMTEFKVPEDVVLVELYARHTTTNLRNAARMIYRYGIPFDRPALISTDADAVNYISSVEFTQRCLTELGYRPGEVVNRISRFDLAWRPYIDALQIDSAEDALDP